MCEWTIRMLKHVMVVCERVPRFCRQVCALPALPRKHLQPKHLHSAPLRPTELATDLMAQCD
jgi:hypothetical protein